MEGFAAQPVTIALRARPVAQPDLVLQVSTLWESNLASFTYQYRLQSFRAGLQPMEGLEVASEALPDGWVERIRTHLANTLYRGAGAGAGVIPALATLGRQLYRTAVPPELRTLLRQIPGGRHSLLVVPDRDGWLPWGLLHDDHSFLAERFILGQWPRELNDARPYEFPLAQVSISYYEQEQAPETWVNLLQPPVGVPIRPRLLEGGVIDLAQASTLYGLHNVRSGQAPGTAGRQDLPIRRGSANSQAQIEQEVNPIKLNLRRSRPLVTLSYLSAGQPELTLLEEAWGRTYTGAGCSGFVGPLWAVGRDVDATFISTFYSALWGGASLGQATHLGQDMARSQHPGSVDWLAYTLLGDPMARPYRPVKGNGYAVVEPVGRRLEDPLPPGGQARFRVMLRRSPPVWYDQRVIEVAEELVFEQLQVHVLTRGLSVVPEPPITLVRTPDGDYLGWFTLVAPGQQAVSRTAAGQPGATTSTVHVYFADGERDIHSIMFPVSILPPGGAE